MKRNLSKPSVRIAAVTAAMAIVPATSFASAENDLKACQAIEDAAARLACYDAALAPEPEAAPEAAAPEVREPVPAMEKPAPAQPAPRPAAGPAPAPASNAGTAEPRELDDEIGRESISTRDRDSLEVRGHVMQCRKTRAGKYRFYFDNGQIWQQNDNKRVSWKDCNFDVTISRDVFGYTMVRDDYKRVYRIERLK